MVANQTSFETLDHPDYFAFGVLNEAARRHRRDGSAGTLVTRHVVVLDRDDA